MPDNIMTVKLKLDNSELIQQLEMLIAGALPTTNTTHPNTLVLTRRLANAERLLLRVCRLLDPPNPLSLRAGSFLARDIERYVGTIKPGSE